MLISEIRDEIITEIGGDSSDTDLQAKIFQFIKTALRRFPRHTKNRLLLTTSYATLNSGKNYLTIPTYFIQERLIYLEENGNREPIQKLSLEDFTEKYNSSATGKPDYYRIIGNVIEFDKTADQDYTIYVEHFKEVDNVNLTDGFFGDTSMVEILKDGVKYYYYLYAEDDARANNQLALFKAGLDELEADFISDDIPTHIEES